MRAIWEDKYQNLANADACLVGVLELDPRNTQAIKDLERLKRAQGRWDELVQIYDRHLSIMPAAAVPDIVDLLIEQGDVWYHKLSRVDRAAEVYNQALEHGPAQQGRHARPRRARTSAAATGPSHSTCSSARPSSSAARAPWSSGSAWARSTRTCSSTRAAPRPPTSARCRSIRRTCPRCASSRASSSSSTTRTATSRRSSRRPRPRWTRRRRPPRGSPSPTSIRDKKEDRDEAATYYEEALRVSPEALAAARPLADIYVAKENWERAEQMLDIVGVRLGEKLSDGPDVGKDLCRQLYRLGYVCEKLGKQKKALEGYRRAYELDSTYLPALEGLGHLLVRLGRVRGGQQGLPDHPPAAPRGPHRPGGRGDLLAARRDLPEGEAAGARAQLLRKSARHRPAARGQPARDDHPGRGAGAVREGAAAAAKAGGGARGRGALRACTPPSPSSRREKLNDPFGAIDAFTNALKVQEDDLATLDQLLALYRDTHQGSKAVEMLERVLDHQDVSADSSSRKRGYYTLAEIYRDEMKDDDKAIEAFNKCLDVDPKFVNAFSAIEQLLAARKQWKKLEENYAAMIKRLPKTEETHQARMALWRTLADLYMRVLKNPAAAMMAYEVVAKDSPDDVATLELYAQLAAEQPEGQEKAITAYRKALPQTANPGKAASSLAKLHALRKEYDEAYVAAQSVVHLLGEGGAEEREILTKLSPFAKRREALPKDKVMTDRMWAEMLFHPKVRGPLGEILSLLQTQAGMLWAHKLGEYRIDARKHRIDLTSGEELAINTFRTVTHVLHLEGIEFYSPYLVARRNQMRGQGGEIPPEQDQFIDLLHTWPLAMKAGGLLFKQSQQKELQFHVGKALAFARPELALARVLPLERLEAIFQAAIVLMAPSYKVTADPRQVDAERRQPREDAHRPREAGPGAAWAQLPQGAVARRRARLRGGRGAHRQPRGHAALHQHRGGEGRPGERAGHHRAAAAALQYPRPDGVLPLGRVRAAPRGAGHQRGGLHRDSAAGALMSLATSIREAGSGPPCPARSSRHWRWRSTSARA